MRLVKPSVKSYHWGMPVHKTNALSFVKDTLDPERIAELWWGHPDVRVVNDDDKVNVPYLLKLLFVEKPLSLQAHPTPEQIQQNPNAFTDPLPKPEIIVALTDFEALCGYAPPEKVLDNLSYVPPLSTYPTFQSVFSHPNIDLLTQDVRKYALYRRNQNTACRVFLSLYDLYPSGDPAILCPFYMNHVFLSKGEALVIPASQPHCYLSGQGIECMPPSDNVVRCGLTSKPCDIFLFFHLTEQNSSNNIPIVQHYPYNHPELDAFFSLRLPDHEGYSYGNANSIVLILEGKGTLNGHTTQQGDSWILDEEQPIHVSPSLDIIVATPPK